MIALIFLLAFDSSYFLQLSPGVMSQGLGGASIMISEGLSVFHNPAYAQDMRFNFTLSRWLYSTNYLALGGSYANNLFGVTYLGYGRIQGYDALGSPTHQFAPYDVCIAIGRKLGPFGLALKGFAENIDGQTLYGLSAAMGFHTRYKNLSVGLRVNNLGKEFAENTSIPTTIGVGLKYNIISGTRLLAEVEIPDLQINGGIIYAYKTMKLLLGLRYLGARDMVNGMSISRGSDDLGVTAGLMVDIDNYTIGYSVVYGHFSVAHHFSVSFVP
jgi:hypothetical protein